MGMFFNEIWETQQYHMTKKLTSKLATAQQTLIRSKCHHFLLFEKLFAKFISFIHAHPHLTRQVGIGGYDKVVSKEMVDQSKVL